MNGREHILNIQRTMLNELKADVERLEGPLSRQIKPYFQEYEKEVSQVQSVVDKVRFLKDLAKADIIFGADFHAYDQSQRTHLRLLRDLIKIRPQIILALESFGANSDSEISKFLSGAISEKKFLKDSRYHTNWGFPWENYSVLLDFARKNKLKVFGLSPSLNPKKNLTLNAREKFSAKRLASLRAKYPDHLIYVVYGDLHVASAHLPKVTAQKMAKGVSTRMLSVFQNSEHVYWKMSEKLPWGQFDVVKLNSGNYCILNSPPWMKWQAYLNHLESITESERDISDIDVIYKMIVRSSEFLKVETPKQDYDVLSLNDRRLFDKFAKKLSSTEASCLKFMIKVKKNFYIPRLKTFVISNHHPNYIASVSGEFIHCTMRGERKGVWNPVENFLQHCWIEGVSFFFSKIYNPNRKSIGILDLPTPSRVSLIVISERLKFHLCSKGGSPWIPPKKPTNISFEDYYRAAKILGGMIGSQIAEGLNSEEIGNDLLVKWLKMPLSGQDFQREFFKILLLLSKWSKVALSKEGRL